MAATIRRMRDGDLPGVLRVLAHWNMAPVAPSAEIPDPERSGIDVTRSFVAEAEGRIVGVASYILHSAQYAETASHAVEPGFRGRGVGNALQLARLREMRALGVRTVRTETDRPETIAWLVKKFGYRVVGRNPKKHAFSLAGVKEWTVLELDLDRADLG
jgi:N-acetylglutamate synthase-like GNAT family acetyltransferase